jgi:hypothetical protein
MKKVSKTIYRMIKIMWFVLGGGIALWTLFWFIKMQTIQDLGVIAGAVLFASGIYILSIYLIITILFLIIKWIFKKIKN